MTARVSSKWATSDMYDMPLHHQPWWKMGRFHAQFNNVSPLPAHHMLARSIFWSNEEKSVDLSGIDGWRPWAVSQATIFTLTWLQHCGKHYIIQYQRMKWVDVDFNLRDRNRLTFLAHLPSTNLVYYEYDTRFRQKIAWCQFYSTDGISFTRVSYLPWL